MKPILNPTLSSLLAGAGLFLSGTLQGADAPLHPKIRALLVAGGCCHDYAGQHKVLSEGIQARANVRVDVVWTDDRSVNPPLPLYNRPDWAKGYDIILHDECAAGNKNLEVMKNILEVHKTIPAVHLHCAMHSFRNGTDQWFRHLGLQSTGHGPQLPIELRWTDPSHPITTPIPAWTTGNEELYNNVKLLDAYPLAIGKQVVKNKDGSSREVEYVVAWTNDKQGARSFSTTLGHNTSTVADDRYLNLVTRGLLWACDKLDDEHLQPYHGSNTVTFVKAEAAAPRKQASAPASSGEIPKDATPVQVSASSTQDQRWTWMAVDGDSKTRWCAAGDSKPQWLQLDFGKTVSLTGVSIQWESPSSSYQYRLEGSLDGKNWSLLHDGKANTRKGNTQDTFPKSEARFLRVTGTGSSWGWISIWELTVQGPGLGKLHAVSENGKSARKDAAWDKEGNVKPRIVRLTPEEEAAILRDVKVPEGFETSLFAPSATANYPVYVAAAPNGDLYVSSDGNGSLGRNPHRGRVLRLRDTNGDGRADEVTEFVPDVDSPRGLIWDHDRLYLLHPPHISVYHDQDGDGVAESSQILIRDIAFGFKDRPADHTTNGLELGMDGWIYIAGGDFGFLDAVGTDGRHLQHRGGGVIRFRPDGTGLELFATGTRNILGTPMSPLLDMFARDNTNDGGGWDVRLHHFTGLEDHGYPRMYKNFPEEHIHPLADYGGGSGCGSVYISEPGFPEAWNNAPFTCDWGRAASFRHTVQRDGATFKETAQPEPFIRMTRPTDADVDALSQVYQASWKGPATFNWNGPDVGYIVRVRPKGYVPEALPNFDQLDDAALMALLDSPSHIRALTAQRTLLRRPESPATLAALARMAGDKTHALRSRVAALYAISQRGLDSRDSARILEILQPLAKDPDLLPFVLRAVGDFGQDLRTAGQPGPTPASWLSLGLQSKDPRTLIEAMVSATRQGNLEVATEIAEHLGHADPVIAHTAFRCLARLQAATACFEVLDTAASSNTSRLGAALALMRIHQESVVQGLIERLESNTQPASRLPILSALCRLFHRESEWKGDSWGTRPDTRGPFYQLETWAASPRILAVLKSWLKKAPAEDAAALVAEMNRNRIQTSEALERILELAEKDSTRITTAVAQLAAVQDIPSRAIPLLLKASQAKDAQPMVLAQTIECLTRVRDNRALPAMLSALDRLQKMSGADKARQAGLSAFLNDPELDNRHADLARLASSSTESAEGRWAHAGLLELASRKQTGPEARAHANKALDVAWQDPSRKVLLMKLASDQKNHHLDDRIRAALGDFDPEVSKAAKSAANRLKIPMPGEDKTPRIETLKTDVALEKVVDHKGDPALGEAIFLKAACATCHTVSQDQQQKGPYLGTIASTYRRPDLALSILNPSQTIAQGFATHIITLKDEREFTGFVTKEAGDSVTLRDVTGQEHALRKSDIESRKTSPDSIMPPGLMNAFTVHEMASLLDYLERLAKGQ